MFPGRFLVRPGAPFCLPEPPGASRSLPGPSWGPPGVPGALSGVPGALPGVPGPRALEAAGRRPTYRGSPLNSGWIPPLAQDGLNRNWQGGVNFGSFFGRLLVPLFEVHLVTCCSQSLHKRASSSPNRAPKVFVYPSCNAMCKITCLCPSMGMDNVVKV